MSNLALARDLIFEPITCCACGIVFAIPAWWEMQLREKHTSFYCPNGHSQSFTGETTAERLRRMLDEANRRNTDLAQAKMNAEVERDSAQRKLKRVKRGVCPCCKRSFIELGRHMKTKHPDFSK